MKVISPIDTQEEVEALLEAGADELYGGFVPPVWQERFSLLTSLNQRTFDSAQISSREELKSIIAAIHSSGKHFSLTLNSPFYSDSQLPIIIDYVADMVAIGVDGIILADIALLRALHGKFPGLELHASTLAHLGNSLAAEVFAASGGSRMILPRHIPVSEIVEIVEASPGISFDAFMLVGKCPNTEGLCTFHHSSSDKIWPCEIPYRIEPTSGPASAALERAIERQSTWSDSNRRHGCGLCAIPHLCKAGVAGLKLVGRGAPTVQKVRNILLVKDFISLAAETESFDQYRQKAISAHRQRFGSACSPNICYFPEFYMAE
jgi:putative protease